MMRRNGVLLQLARALGASGCGALALAYLLPGHYSPWSSFEQQVLAAVGAVLIALAACAAAGLDSAANGRLVVPRASIALLLLAFVPALQFASGLLFFSSDAWLAGG